MQRKAEEQKSSSCCLHTTTGNLDLFSAPVSLLSSWFISWRIHSVAIITKVTMPNWGNWLCILYSSYILTFDIYTFWQFYICSRFRASLLCLIKCSSWLSQAITTSKPTNQATLFDWREEICLCSGGEIMTTSYSHLGCISWVSSSVSIKMLWPAYLDGINSQVVGEQVLISSSLSPDEVGCPPPGQMPVPHNQYAQIRG